jgi:hypothetical protein
MATGEFLSEWFYPYFEDMIGNGAIPYRGIHLNEAHSFLSLELIR